MSETMKRSALDRSDERVERSDNLVNTIFKNTHNGGRHTGSSNLSPTMRSIIGAAAKIDGNIKQTASTFHVSETAVSNYARGSTSRMQPAKPEAVAAVQSLVQAKKESIRDKSLSRIESLFDGPISSDNVNTLKPREAIQAAKDLANIVDKLQEKANVNDNRVQFVIFAPRTKDEKEYDTIDVDSREV